MTTLMLFFALCWHLILCINSDLTDEKWNDREGCLIRIRSFAGVLLYSIETQQTIGYGT